MQLVMKRERTESGLGWYKFTINARLVLEAEEDELVRKYSLSNVALTPGDARRDIRRAAWISGIVSLILYSFLFHTVGITIIVFLAIGFLVYAQIREEVRVSDLLTGRNFRARSLVQLLVREYRIRKMSGVFAIVIEQARTWHEPEVIQVEPKPLGILLAPTPEGDYEVT